MSTQPLTRNITAAFRAATDNDRAVGYGWYARARDLAESLVKQYGWDMSVAGDWDREVTKAAGVIAALSPRLAWRKNVEYAELAYLHFKSLQAGAQVVSEDLKVAAFCGLIPTLNANARKAYRILNGEHAEDVLGGPKVRAFYFTIVNPSDPRAVVVDRHAVSIAYNRPMTDDEIGKALSKKGSYDTISHLYRRAAQIISAELCEEWTPAQVQAATWTYWRRERAMAYHAGVIKRPVAAVNPNLTVTALVAGSL